MFTPPQDVTCHVSYVTCHVSCVACHVSHVMCHMSCVTCHVSHVTIFFFIWTKWWSLLVEGCYQRGLPRLVNIPVGATLQTPLSLINSLTDSLILCENSFKTVRSRELPHVLCHRSCVTFQKQIFIHFSRQSGEASQWRVCYQRGYPV